MEHVTITLKVWAPTKKEAFEAASAQRDLITHALVEEQDYRWNESTECFHKGKIRITDGLID